MPQVAGIPNKEIMPTASIVSKGIPIDSSLVGEFTDSSALLGQPEQLHARLKEDDQ